MDNPNISETSREKLEDAAAFVIMEQYAKALNAGINKRMEDCAEEDFPEELDKRCRALIAQASRKDQNKKRRKSALRVLRSAAVVALVMLSLCSVLFMTVEAFRIPVMSFFVEKTDKYWELNGMPNENWMFDGFNEENPLDGIIPDSFDLINKCGTIKDGNFIAEYSNANKSTIVFFVNHSNTKLQIDGEDAYILECQVAGHDAKLYAESETVRVAWLDENVSLTFNLCATNVSQEAVVSFAEIIASWFD